MILRRAVLSVIVVAGLASSSTMAHASPPVSRNSETVVSPRAKRQLVAGGTLIGLGLAAEVTGASIAASCQTDMWCSRGFVLTLGQPDNANRLVWVASGPSVAYVGARITAMPFLISGFSLTMVGLGHLEYGSSTWSARRVRRTGWSLLGTGVGILVGSRILRLAFLGTGTCQDVLCVHGLDQTTLWVGRGLTFAGTGLLVRSTPDSVALVVGPGPAGSHGLSLLGRF